MKKCFLYSVVLLAVTFVACKKDLFKDYDKAVCEVEICEVGTCPSCTSVDYQDPQTSKSGLKVYILKELKTSTDCGCIVAGYVKYLKDGKTVALVDYGNGECDNLAVKTLCVDGKCDHEQATACQFVVNCTASN